MLTPPPDDFGLDEPTLGLSPRARRSLLRAGYATIADTEAASDKTLLGIHRFGTTQLREVRAKTAQFRSIAAVVSCPLRVPAAAEIAVADLEITSRTRDRLLGAGLLTAAEVEARTENDLLALPGFGATCLADYKEARRLHAARFGVRLDTATLIRRRPGTARDQRWEQRCALVAAHMGERHGRPLPARFFVTAPSGEQIALGAWVAKQRDHYRRDLLAPPRVAALEAVPGWTWEARVGRPAGHRAA